MTLDFGQWRTTSPVTTNSAASTPRRRPRRSTWPGALILGLLLTIGSYKESLPFFGVDPTLLVAVLALGACAARLLNGKARVPRNINTVLLFFFVLTFGIPFASLDGYSVSKILRLFSLGLLSVSAPILLLRSRRSIRRFFHISASIGAILVVIVALRGPDQAAQLGRYTADASGVSNVSRMIALPLLWVGVLALNRYIPFRRALIVSVIALWFMVRTGQRGPLLALGITALVAVLAKASSLRRVHRVLIVVMIAVAGWYLLTTAPESATSRLHSIGPSGQERLDSYAQTLHVIVTHPFGVGWGDWGDYVNLFANASREYPHNLLLEVTAEGGILVGIALVLFLKHAIASANRISGAEGQAILLLLLFSTVTAMFSGDINDNRMLLVAIGLAFVKVPDLRRATIGTPPTSLRTRAR